MEILRLANTSAIDAKFTVLNASAVYTLEYEDLITGATYSASAMSLANKTITFRLDNRYLAYTGKLFANVYDTGNNIVISTGIDVLRPYCDIDSVKAKLEITNAQAVEAERVARNIIESEAGEFQFVRKQKETTGMGIDFLPFNEKIVKLYYLWENDVLTYDYQDETTEQYKISIDKTSVIPYEGQNKTEYRRVWRDRYSNVSFGDGYDYVVDADFGYQVIPSDVQEACEILIQDIISDGMRYFSRNISEFDNNEFKVKFADSAVTGTGNLIADKLLSKYKNKIKPGVI
jgi:hypothetical protein